MKYRHKLGLNNEKIGRYIESNPKQFSTIFFEKSSNKSLPLGVIASKDSYRFLPEEFKGYFNEYISKEYQNFV